MPWLRAPPVNHDRSSFDAPLVCLPSGSSAGILQQLRLPRSRTRHGTLMLEQQVLPCGTITCLHASFSGSWPPPLRAQVDQRTLHIFWRDDRFQYARCVLGSWGTASYACLMHTVWPRQRLHATHARGDAYICLCQRLVHGCAERLVESAMDILCS